MLETAGPVVAVQQGEELALEHAQVLVKVRIVITPCLDNGGAKKSQQREGLLVLARALWRLRIAHEAALLQVLRKRKERLWAARAAKEE